MFDGLKFAGNSLRVINLHRSDCLRKISVWAPNLEHLGLQACYDLECINLQRAHPVLGRDLPKWHRPTHFTVNTRYSDEARLPWNRCGGALGR